MAIYLRHMCPFMKFNGCHTARIFSSYILPLKHKHVKVLSAKSTVKLLSLSCVREYSTQKTGITEEILKAKVVESQESQAEGSADRGSEKKKDSKWTGKNAWKLGLVLLAGWAIMTGGGLVFIWGGPDTDPEGNPIKDEYSDLNAIEAYIKRTYKEFQFQKQKIKDPSREKLLPEPLQYPYIQPPYTLVLEMTGVLIHPDWTYGTGWRFKKRPFVDQFLQQVGPPLFEVVIYTSEQGYNADPILNNLDPHGYIMYRLYRDSTKYTSGHHVKDLSCLNRDMSKVIFIDHNVLSYQLQPKNAFHLARWKGEDDDKKLIDLAQFLRALAASGVEDVRGVLEYYSQFDDPLAAFRENQRALQAQQEMQAQKLKEQDDKKIGWFGFRRNR